MYYIAENLELRHDEVALRLADMTGRGLDNCKQEVDISIKRLFYWGAYADKYGGKVQVSLLSLFSIECSQTLDIVIYALLLCLYDVIRF